ncbi:hypothetical protein AVEN_174174-1 [Araneus ventricosus]|uniref:Uncharacterized protein n=1 Tax=Araneus ventricosus TaxID=182803 RepID=A0A4Y2U887_ARAVE|nr:hypothetical protein AVEN_174174-1 [Araneus ventricosus]
MSQIILVLSKPVLDDVSCVNRGFVVLEDTITIGEQSLYHGMDLIGQNVQIILGLNVALQSNHGAHTGTWREGRDSSLCVVLLKNPFNFRNHFLLGYVPQHRTLKLQDTRQDREQHHETSTQTGMTERHHGKKMAPVVPPTIERRRQLIVTATWSV